ncbi:adhesion domain-containing protein [Aeromonas mytilicola subsp. aquatica]|uniref:adhesion domain-containing protein n=1 Tax=Aeromonas mytilicola TaxID=3377113 RepID=UPI0037BF94B1
MCRKSIVKILRLTLCWPLVVGTAVAADISVTSTFVSAGPTCDATAGAGMGDYSTPDGSLRQWDDANNYCISQGLRLATDDEMRALYKAYPNNEISSKCKWPTDEPYWESDQASSSSHFYVHLNNGNSYTRPDSFEHYVTCIR